MDGEENWNEVRNLVVISLKLWVRVLQVKWGCDLQSEHERYLTEEAFSGNPVIVTDYPKVNLCLAFRL